MCLLALEIGMLVMGIFALIKGKVSLTSSRVVFGAPARLIGVLLMLPLPLALLATFVLGVMKGAQGQALDQRAIDELQTQSVIIQVGLVLGCFLLSLVIGLLLARSPTETKKAEEARKHEHEDDDEDDGDDDLEPDDRRS